MAGTEDTVNSVYFFDSIVLLMLNPVEKKDMAPPATHRLCLFPANHEEGSRFCQRSHQLPVFISQTS
jgi:hypothetical protein